MLDKVLIKRTIRLSRTQNEKFNKIISLKKVLGEKTDFSKLSRYLIQKEIERLEKELK